MKIFAQEIQDGLEAQLSTSASITYTSVAEPCNSDSTIKHIKSIAAILCSIYFSKFLME